MNPLNKIKYLPYWVISAMFMVCFTGCDNSIATITPDPGKPFSIYGHLDANSDIQWVRVTPIRDSLFSAEEQTDAVVTLYDHDENLTIELNDSVFYQIGGNGERISYFNFYTSYKIHPLHTYTLTATNTDGISSKTTVQIPADFDVPVIASNTGSGGRINGEGVGRIVIFDVAYDLLVVKVDAIFTEKIVVSQFQRNTVNQYENGRYFIQVDDGDYLSNLFDINAAEGEFIQVEDARIYMAAGNESWPDAEYYTFDELSLPEYVSNVENGIGVFVGINTLIFPLEGCETDNVRHPCEELDISFDTIYEYQRF